ncbi:arrestin domain-containing protein 3-like isoform X2 [Rhinichthys klamathensis goyatoka]|uniref:arrestin domain-containing protein 3-like isoform X2 n=1 Tax=Rhinichthys klamathensis goyatoka TaxID=3034132 RepID=UPI0024B56279|nr:arrestin domain-containing protein 3-like isoform X2 [Rhinichthys klamathensis goyatoka]
MSLTVKNISVIYNPINQNNTFTSGDFISGQVILDVAKDTKMQSLSVKIKGKAEVCWTERHGKTTVVYSDKEKYYSVEKFFVREEKTHDPSVVVPGRHVYPFTFQLPLQHFPPTFKASVGKIVYTLETKLSRSMRISSKAKAEFHYVPSPVVSNPELMAPQYGTKDKQMKLFTSGSVSMNINTEKMGYYLGEGLKILAEVQNNTSRTIKPKYCLYEKHSFFARGKRKLHTQDLFKEEGDPIEPNSRKTVTKVLPIPPSLTVSILNCRVLKVEYRLRVYLDVPYASDPEIKFPIVILPLQSLSAASSATNSDFQVWNAYRNPPQSAPPLNVFGQPGQFAAPGHYRPPLSQFPAPGYPGPPLSQSPAPGYPGPPLSQSPAPGYPGPPGQFAPSSYAGLPGQFGPTVSHQSDSSAPPPYLDYQLYPQLPDHPEKS